MTGVEALLLSFLTDPRVGFPALLLIVAAGLWLVRGPVGGPRRTGAESRPPRPDRDPVSRTYLALEEENYGELLNESFDRLDRALEARTGHHLTEIPWRRRAARRLGIPEPEGLRAVRDRLINFRAWAYRLEADSWLRWDFWRSRELSRRRLLTELPPLLGRIDGHLDRLETSA
ncbi:MAG: hypothetical protein ACYDFT_07825 [Thermoplasmata archaeon]